MAPSTVRARLYLGTVPDRELKYLHTLASSVHTRIRVPCKFMHVWAKLLIYVTILAHVWLYHVLPTYICTCMLGYDCYEYVIDQVLDASYNGSPCLVLFCIALASFPVFFIRERGSWSLVASFISSLHYYDISAASLTRFKNDLNRITSNKCPPPSRVSNV
jgi:hypothetical protein